MLDKFEIASALREIALLLELKGENPYKARAYVKGASAIESVNEDLDRLIADGRLTTISGIGESLAQQIRDLHDQGKSPLLERLRRELPPGVIELSQIPGLSIKKIQQLHEELGIETIQELEQACLSGQVSTVRGFGKKSQQNILQGIETYHTREHKELLLHALDTARSIVSHLSGPRAIKKVEAAGSIRRWQEVVSQLDFVAETADAQAACKAFQRFPLATTGEMESGSECAVRLADGMTARLHLSNKTHYAAALLFATGSPAHVAHLQAIAAEQGMTLSESGLRKKDRLLACETEADIYDHLGLPYIPPEMREDWGELEQALAGENFDDLLRAEDIVGMTHCHTVYSDGKASIEEMALAAQKMGMKYITITDHSPAAHYAGGLDVDRLKRQWEEIARVQESVSIKLLRGTESDILENGALDYPDHILDHLDVIIASIHSRLKMDEEQMTRRLINCLKQPQFKIWGHALGRLVLRRQPLACRLEEVLDVAAQSRAAIEVNGDPYRLDLPPEWIRKARERGIRFVVSVDAHSTGALNYLRFGVQMARRGGLRRKDVLNTYPLDNFAAAVRPRVVSQL